MLSLYVQTTARDINAGSSWLRSFLFPDKFSPRTMDSISTGIVVSSSKSEIMSTLAMCIFQHTTYPTSDEYNAVCRQLFQKYPSLRDESTSGYVSSFLNVLIYQHVCNLLWQGSWKLALRQKMKNIRRPPKAHGKENKATEETEKCEDHASEQEPLRKKQKVSTDQCSDEPEEELVDEVEYERLLEKIKAESEKNHTTKVYSMKI